MPYGTPVGYSQSAQYILRMRHANEEQYVVTVTVDGTMTGLTEQELKDFFQDLVDDASAMPHFQVTSAVQHYPTEAPVTPTP